MLDDVILLDGTEVVDLQATRLAVCVRKFQQEHQPLFEELAKAAGVPLLTMNNIEDEASEDLGLILAVADVHQGLRIRKKDGFLRASWTPFALFIDCKEVCSLKASYDSREAKLTGVRLLVDGEPSISRRKNMKASVARKVCLSYIHTYFQDEENEHENS